MDVFLVPVAADRYELYCEEPDDPEPAADAPAPAGFFPRLAHRMRGALAAAERERRDGAPPNADVPTSLFGRLKARTIRWAAEWMAEQRLLWQLRGRTEARLLHPSDVTDPQARQLLKRSLQRDWERHRFWLVVDALGLAVSALLILLPGPNVIGYYFLVRTVGHYFSLRGARRGLTGITWELESSPDLAALRTMVAEAPDARAARVDAVAAALRLEHFASFFQRSATP